MKPLQALLMSLVVVMAPGCGAPAPQPVKQAAAPTAPPPFVPPGLEPAGVQPPPADVVREKAQVGMIGKGQGYGGDPITEPVRQLWRVKEQIVLIQIEKAVQLFEATENRKIASNDEFMAKIIKENQIALPVLPPGHRYVFDPAKSELMVERPK